MIDLKYYMNSFFMLCTIKRVYPGLANVMPKAVDEWLEKLKGSVSDNFTGNQKLVWALQTFLIIIEKQGAEK